ncbi:hypothetical protein MF271_16555 [Deinococcus sp. KNUC1210]|uniref:hypothetical protein n=1 Tax=Deinococcus sp. KNUC1210 TaxID=2917691 RepID=UPI001EF15635|nr:hypothetical protein [Deinococcus sp. KNUC1210]ULH15502.1 hypothetical protein MF271_16555 [Deinococcus sp. KNUC1210]
MPRTDRPATAAAVHAQLQLELQLRAVLRRGVPDAAVDHALRALLARCRPGGTNLPRDASGQRRPEHLQHDRGPHPLVVVLHGRRSAARRRLAERLVPLLHSTFPPAGLDLQFVVNGLAKVLLRGAPADVAAARQALIGAVGPHLLSLPLGEPKPLLRALLTGLSRDVNEHLWAALTHLGAVLHAAPPALTHHRVMLLYALMDLLDNSGLRIPGVPEPSWAQAAADACWALCGALDLQDDLYALRRLSLSFALPRLEAHFASRLIPARLPFREALAWSAQTRDARGWVWRVPLSGPFVPEELDELRCRAHQGTWNGHDVLQDLRADGSFRSQRPLSEQLGYMTRPLRSAAAYAAALQRWPSPGLSRELGESMDVRALLKSDPDLRRVAEAISEHDSLLRSALF